MPTGRIPSRGEILRIMERKGCSQADLDHGQMVADLSLITADNMTKDGKSLNREVLEAGALLHDIGGTMASGPVHGVIGSKILLELGFPSSVARIAETHEVGGITRDEAARLQFPPEDCVMDHVPESLEENIVAFVDNLLWTYLHEKLDPWKDTKVAGASLYEHLNKSFKKVSGQDVSVDDPIFTRVVQRATVFIRYVSKYDVDELSRKYHRK